VTDLISCIIPAHNARAFIAEALHSVLAQTHPNLEVIVVDDESTDGTVDVVQRLNMRVDCLRQRRAGPAAARNLGLSKARGDYIAFVDADDLWHPLKLAHQLERLRCASPGDACVAYVRNVASDEMTGALPDQPEPADRGIPGYVAGTLLARRSVFERVGPFDPSLPHGASLDWFVRARESGIEVLVVDEVLMYRRIHDASLSRRDAESSRREHLRVLRNALARRKAEKA